MRLKRLLAFVVSLAMVLSIIPAGITVSAEESVIDLSNAPYIISADGNYTVTGNTTNTLTVTSNATITLDNLTVNAEANCSAISIESGNVIINVANNASLTGGDNGAGIYVAEGASVTITGEGTLTAIGNAGADDASGAAGIGGTWANGNSGAITIDGATVVAAGYGVHGAGIGSGSGKVVGAISIVNGADVTAQGGYYVEGGKFQTSRGGSDPEGGAAIGGGGKTASEIATITITESTVTAYGGSKAAGIGANFWSSCEKIAITGSTIIAQGGGSSAGIGTSRAGSNGVSANIEITNSKVNATGGDYGAAIGGGYNGDSLGNGADESGLPVTSITITGGIINATGGEGGAAIGGGYKTDNVDIKIDGSANVTAIAGELVSGKTVEDGGAPSAIGTGANGSGKFENTPAAVIAETAKVTIFTYNGGKDAIAGVTNAKLAEQANVTVVYINADAMIGNTVYETLDAALAAVKDGETVTLLKDITVSGVANAINYTGSASFTLDFNGKTLIANTTNSGVRLNINNDVVTESVEITLKNGIVNAASSAYCAVIAAGKSEEVTLTVNIENMTMTNSHNYGFNVKAFENSTVNVKAGTKIVSTDGQGGVYAQNGSVINVYDGVEIVQQGTATTYMGANIGVSGTGVVNVYGGTFTSDKYNANVMSSGGTLNVVAGTFTSTSYGVKVDSWDSTIYAPSVANISGGTFTAPTVVWVGANEGEKYSSAANITGGTFNGKLDGTYGGEQTVIAVSGGTFDQAVAEEYCAEGYEPVANDDGTYGVQSASTGSITPGYTNATSVWGEGGGNASESFCVELYVGEEKIATTTLNNIGGIIDGDVYVTWSIPFAGSTDEYWTVEWAEGHPNAAAQPTNVVLYIDGEKVAENVVKMSRPDNLEPVKWEELDFTKPVAEVAGVKYADLREAVLAATEGQTVTLLTDVTIDGIWNCCPIASGVTIDGNGKTFKIADVGHYESNSAFYGEGYNVVNLTVERTGTDATGDNALSMNGGYAENVTINGTFGSGIVAAGGVNVVDCVFNNTTWGIYAEAGNTVGSVTGSTFNSLRAVALYDNEIFTGNTVTGDKGLSLATTDATVTGNTFTGARAISVSNNINGSAAIERNKFLNGSTIEVSHQNSPVLSANYWSEGYDAQIVPDGDATIGASVGSYYTDEALTNLVTIYVAEVNGTQYATLTEALAAANDGDTVKILADFTLKNAVDANTPTAIDKDIILDLNGKIIQATGHVFRIEADVTVKNGTVEAYDMGYTFFVGRKVDDTTRIPGNLTIESGTYSGQTSVVNVTEGLVTILGGEFSVEPYQGTNYNYFFNCVDSRYPDNANVIVKGGTFHNFNPANNAAEGKGTNFVAEGYEVVDFGDDTYGVEKEGLAGSGTVEDPFIIKDIADLKWFRDDVNDGNTYSKQYVMVADDVVIDLNNEEWTPIGTSTSKFQGNFDGNDVVIQNLVITGNNSYVGLFGYTTSGSVKNLTVNNAKVSGRIGVGVVAGSPFTTDYSNITLTGLVQVNGMSYVGGVLGRNAYGDITDITINADETSYVKAVSTENGTAYRTYVGGVVGFLGEGGHIVKNVTSNLDVEGDVCDIGGIAGIAHYGNTFENVTCSGTVTGPESEAEIGGIAGVWHNQKGKTVTFTNCEYSGESDVKLVGAPYTVANNTEETSGKLIVNGKVTWPIPKLPTATVTEIVDKNAPELTFTLNFKADEATDEQLAYYGDWIADYVLTVNKTGTYNSDGSADGYLAGQYDAFNTGWVLVPDGNVTLEADTPLKIMEYAGLPLTYALVYDFVKDFDCGVFFDEEFLVANPDLVVTLELRLYNPDDEDESYIIGETYVFTLPTATVTDSNGNIEEYETLEAAIAAAESGDTVTLLKDVADTGNVTLKSGVILDGNGNTISGNSAIYMAKSGASTVMNVNFKNIHNDAGKLSAIYATGLEADAAVTITGNTFDNVDWDAIQATSKVDDAAVAITGNTFTNTDDTPAYRYVHVQPTAGCEINLTVTGNKMDTNNGAVAAAIGVYYVSDEAAIDLSGNYVDDHSKVAIILNDGERQYNAAEVVLPFVEEDMVTEVNYAAVVSKASLWEANFYATLEEAVGAAGEGDRIEVLQTTVIADDTTLDLKNVTITGDIYPVIRVQNGATVTVKNGNITNGDYIFVLGASDGSSEGNLIIENGKYHAQTTVASVTKGVLTVNGGEFSVDPYEGNYNFLLNCIDANYDNGSSVIEVKGGTFHNFNPAENAAEGKGTNFVAEGYEVIDNGDGTWTVEEKVELVITYKLPVYGPYTAEYKLTYADADDLIEAIKTVNETFSIYNPGFHYGMTIELFDDADIGNETADIGVVLEAAENANITIIGNSHTITSAANKTVVITDGGSPVVFKDVTIENTASYGRAVDTRTNVDITLDTVTLTTTGSGNTQPLTIGGDAGEGNVVDVTVTNSVINAGESGYGIITFNPVNMTITDSEVSGYSALYLKAASSSQGSAGSVVKVVNSTLTSVDDASDGDVFAAVVLEDNNITLDVDANSAISAENTIAIAFSHAVNNNTTENNSVTVAGTINAATILLGWEEDVEVVSVKAEYEAQLTEEGYNTETSATEGMIDVTGKIEYAAAVTTTDGGVTEYETLADAFAAAVDGDTVTLLADNAESVEIADYATIEFITGEYTYLGTVTLAAFGAWIISDEKIDVTSTVEYEATDETTQETTTVKVSVVKGEGNNKFGYVAMPIGVDLVNGAQVRIGSGVDDDGKVVQNDALMKGSGLRFVTEIDRNDTLAYFADEPAEGDKTYTKYVVGVNIRAEASESVVEIPAYYWQTDNIFTSALTNLAVSNYVRKFTASTYVDIDGIRYESNEEDWVTRSIYQVAAGLLINKKAEVDSDGNHIYDPTAENLIEVLNAYVNQTGIRLVLVDYELKAHDGTTSSTKGGDYGSEAFFEVSETSYNDVTNTYKVTLTAKGNAEIKNNVVSKTNKNFWYEYIRINNNNSVVREKVTVTEVEEGKVYTLEFNADGTGLERPDNEESDDVFGEGTDNETGLTP